MQMLLLLGSVVQTMDLGSHTLFLADVTDGEVLLGRNPITYSYYQKNTKPKVEKTEKKGYRCKICGYIYEVGTFAGGVYLSYL